MAALSIAGVVGLRFHAVTVAPLLLHLALICFQCPSTRLQSTLLCWRTKLRQLDFVRRNFGAKKGPPRRNSGPSRELRWTAPGQRPVRVVNVREDEGVPEPWFNHGHLTVDERRLNLLTGYRQIIAGEISGSGAIPRESPPGRRAKSGSGIAGVWVSRSGRLMRGKGRGSGLTAYSIELPARPPST